jgi:cytoskeletal protein CcmA (bactofilin family)
MILASKYNVLTIGALFISLLSTSLLSPWIMAEGGPDLLGNDLFTTSDKASINSRGVDDIFVMARAFDLNQAVSGSVHTIAKDVNINATVGNSVYAAGDRVSLNADVVQDVLVVGQAITIRSNISGDLRGAGDAIEIDGMVAGDIQLAGQSIILNAPVHGSATFATDDLSFGPAARIDGDLILYGKHGTRFDIPARVIDPERVIYRASNQMIDNEFIEPVGKNLGTLGLGIFYELLVAILVTSIIVIIANNASHNAYNRAWSGVWSSLGYGFVGLALLSGGVIVTAVTFIGIPVSILLIAATIIVTIVGYWMGSYFIGARIWLAARGELPSSVVMIILTATLGALCAELISAIPFIGWWLTIAITVFGVGALSPWRAQRVTGAGSTDA